MKDPENQQKQNIFRKRELKGEKKQIPLQCQAEDFDLEQLPLATNEQFLLSRRNNDRQRSQTLSEVETHENYSVAGRCGASLDAATEKTSRVPRVSALKWKSQDSEGVVSRDKDEDDL